MEFGFSEDFKSKLEQFFGSREKQLIFGKGVGIIVFFYNIQKNLGICSNMNLWCMVSQSIIYKVEY